MGVLRPPVALALAKDEREVPGPETRWANEPKFDGWRAALFTATGVVQSRRDNNLASRFPEIVAAGRVAGDLVLDGEVVALREGRLDFGALTSSPKSRAQAGVAIYYVAFDLLAAADIDLRGEPYRTRRAELETRLAGIHPPLQLVPSTLDRAEAMQWMRPEVATIGIKASSPKTPPGPTARAAPATGARSARRSSSTPSSSGSPARWPALKRWSSPAPRAGPAPADRPVPAFVTGATRRHRHLRRNDWRTPPPASYGAWHRWHRISARPPHSGRRGQAEAAVDTFTAASGHGCTACGRTSALPGHTASTPDAMKEQPCQTRA